MTPEIGTLTQVLNAFLEHFRLGTVAVGDTAWSLMSILATIEIALFGLTWALSGSNAIGEAFKKILTLGFFIFVISNYAELLNVVVSGFEHTAQKASGNALTLLEDPSQIIDAGFKATLPALKLAQDSLSLFSLKSYGQVFIVIVCVFAIFIAYVSLAIQVFLTRIEFGLVATLGLIFLPFGVLKQTAFLAEKLFSAILGFGVKLMILGVLVAIAWPILSQWALPEQPDWGHLLNMFAATFALTVLAFHAPGVVSAMLSGSPSLSHRSAMGTGFAIAAPLVGGMKLAANATDGGLTRGTAWTAKAGWRAAGGAAAKIGSAFQKKESTGQSQGGSKENQGSKPSPGSSVAGASRASEGESSSTQARFAEEGSPEGENGVSLPPPAAQKTASAPRTKETRASLQNEYAAYRPFNASRTNGRGEAGAVPSLRPHEYPETSSAFLAESEEASLQQRVAEDKGIPAGITASSQNEARNSAPRITSAAKNATLENKGANYLTSEQAASLSIADSYQEIAANYLAQPSENEALARLSQTQNGLNERQPAPHKTQRLEGAPQKLSLAPANPSPRALQAQIERSWNSAPAAAGSNGAYGDKSALSPLKKKDLAKDSENDS